MKNSVFAVELRGKGVYRGSSIVGYITDTTEEILQALRSTLGEKYKIEVDDFHLDFGVLVAKTSRNDVRIIIQEIFEL